MLDPKKSLFDEDGNPRPALTTTLDNVLRMQRPLALSIVKKLREAHPDETPEQIHKRLDRTYLRDITAIGGGTRAPPLVPHDFGTSIVVCTYYVFSRQKNH